MMDFDKYPVGISSRRHPKEFALFKKEALEVAEMPLDHPSADMAFDHAWEDGHAYGLNEVVSNLIDLVEIIKPEIWQELQALKNRPHYQLDAAIQSIEAQLSRKVKYD